jgi:ribonuclease HII
MNKNPSFKFENALWEKGLKLIAGLDEVGRGCFAGPVVAAAVVLPQKFEINGIKDSKMLSPKKREELSEYIKTNAQSYQISEVDVSYINKFGIGKATEKAFLDCITKLKQFDHLLIDGFKLKDFDKDKQTGIIHGDQLSVSIAAASIIAKVYRDNLMVKLHSKFPLYDFEQNKGYGTKKHIEAIGKYGLIELHRTSFDLTKYSL